MSVPQTYDALPPQALGEPAPLLGPVVAHNDPVVVPRAHLDAEPQHATIQDAAHPSTVSQPSDPTAIKQAPTSSIDPNIPSSESAPTALPTNPNTNPAEQKEAMKNEHPAVIKREVEKTKAAEREVKGEKPLGTVVRGVEDDRLYAMLRMFDTVCPLAAKHADDSTSHMSCTLLPRSQQKNRIYDPPNYPICPPIQKLSRSTWSELLRLSGHPP
jgi:hypothetical protein